MGCVRVDGVCAAEGVLPSARRDHASLAVHGVQPHPIGARAEYRWRLSPFSVPQRIPDTRVPHRQRPSTPAGVALLMPLQGSRTALGCIDTKNRVLLHHAHHLHVLLHLLRCDVFLRRGHCILSSIACTAVGVAHDELPSTIGLTAEDLDCLVTDRNSRSCCIDRRTLKIGVE